VARHERTPPTDELAAQAELRQQLVQAVLDLHEPYRSTILLSFMEELSPSVIAARTGTCPATVRSRLKRALDQLRRRCSGSGQRGWCRGLFGVLLLCLRPRTTGLGLGLKKGAAYAALVVFSVSVGSLARVTILERSGQVATRIPARLQAALPEPRPETESRLSPRARGSQAHPAASRALRKPGTEAVYVNPFDVVIEVLTRVADGVRKLGEHELEGSNARAGPPYPR
jgi:hypothetical protein